MQWVLACCDGVAHAAFEGFRDGSFGCCARVGVCPGCEGNETGFGDFAGYIGVVEDSGGGGIETGGYVEAAVVGVFKAFFEFGLG